MGKKKLTAHDRRAQLIAVGCAVFAKHGYDAASMEEIARKAGVSKPVVYEHFGGKEGLYAVIVDREIQGLVTHIVTSISEGTPRKRFERAILAFLTYAKEHPDGFAVLRRDPPNRRARRGIEQVIVELGQRVRAVFEEELSRVGLNAQVSPLYANALIGMLTQVGQWWVEDPEMPMRDVARHLAALGWLGLRHLPKEPVLLD
jgi:AcrR family transcriptional regulator